MAKQVSFNGYLLRQFGAYIRTDLSALVQINGVASGVIGIMGLAEKGPTNKAVTISGYTELVNTFGDGPLVRHGLAAYVGGANTLVAVRLDDENSAVEADRAASAFLTVKNVNSTDAYFFEALEKGTYGNGISVRVNTPTFDTTLVASSDTVVSSASQYSGVLTIPESVASTVSLISGTHKIVERWNASASGGGFDPNSYSVFVWGGTRWSLAKISSLKTIITTRVGSIEENVEVPYFIDDTIPWVKALLETDGEPYYVLLNTETQQVREVPRSWLAAEIEANLGALTFEAFDRIVNDLKSEDEILFSGTNSVYFGLSLDKPTRFPFELAKHIVNFGGFGSGPSGILKIDNIDEENPEISPQGFVQLEFGSNSVDGTGWVSTVASNAGTFTQSPSSPGVAWDNALAILENEDVNFVQPAYFFGSEATFSSKYSFFSSLASKILTHVNLMSNTPNRKFRTSVLGLPSGQDGTGNLSAAQFLERTEGVSGLLNSDRIQLWGGGFYSTALEQTRTPKLYGGEWLASFVVGAHAAREVSVSLTFAPLAGIFTDGLEYAWTSGQKDELYGRSLAFVLKRRTSTGATEFVAAHNYTSFTGAPTRGLQLFITRRIVDFMNSFIYKNLEENFIGRKSRGEETANELSAFVEALLSTLITDDILVAFSGLTVTADPLDKTVYYVEFSFQPVTEINFILTTNRLVYNLA
jgi:hypothetical protein